MTYYIASMSISFILSVLLDEPAADGPSFALLIPILVLATVTGVLSFMAWVYLAVFLRPQVEPVPVLISFPLALSIVAVQATLSTLWNVILDVPSPSVVVTALSLLVVYVFDETFIATVLRNKTGRIVDDVRSFRGTLPARRRAAPASANGSAAVVATGTATFPADTILQLQAQGNHVQIWTDTDSALVPGPFSALLARMPDGLGCLVHRSEWVATRAVLRAERHGRATELFLSNGNTVRVASTRAGIVRDWLAQFEAKPSRRRTPSSSGGGDTKRQSPPAPDTSTTAMGANTPSAPKAAVIPSKS